MSEPISPRMADALDVAVERMLVVLLNWGENQRGPNNGWTLGLADVVASLVASRKALDRPDTPEDA